MKHDWYINPQQLIEDEKAYAASIARREPAATRTFRQRAIAAKAERRHDQSLTPSLRTELLAMAAFAIGAAILAVIAPMLAQWMRVVVP